MVPVGRAPHPSLSVGTPSIDDGPERAPKATRTHEATVELAIGVVLVVLVLIGGIYVAHRPGPGPLDRLAFSIVGSNESPVFRTAAHLRSPLIVVIGAVVVGTTALVCRRDRGRVLACVLGPPAVLLISEALVKPTVGRMLGSSYSYPSGTTVAVSALGTAAVLATAARWRVLTSVMAFCAAMWTAATVVALGWHFPTDAGAGVCFGVGGVLVVDGLVWHLWQQRRPRLRPVSPSGG